MTLTNGALLEQAEMSGIDFMLLMSELDQTGHVFQMDDFWIPKITLYVELFAGHPRKDIETF